MNQLQETALKLRVGEFANQHDDAGVGEHEVVQDRHVELTQSDAEHINVEVVGLRQSGSFEIECSCALFSILCFLLSSERTNESS